jgi:hypothetical protein
MKSKLALIGVVSLLFGQIAPASSSAFAQSTAEGSNKSILDQHASPANAPGTTASGNVAPVGAAAYNGTSYGRGARPANNQSTISPQRLAGDPPASFRGGKAGRESESIRGRSVLETPPCLGAGHYYVASVVNSVESSCFLGDKGPGPLGGF